MSLAYAMEERADKKKMLDDLNVEVVLDVIPIEEINEDGAKQIRPDDAVPPADDVRRFAMEMRNGDVFPPIIAYTPNGTARYGLAGGAGRLAAAKKNGATTIPAYIMISPTERQVFRARLRDNKHGRALTLQEQVKQASLAMDQYDMSQQAAADEVGIAVHTFRHYRERDAARLKAREAGLSETDIKEVADSALMHIAKIRHPEVRRKVFKLVADKRYKTKRTEELVKAIKAQPSDDQQLELIDRETQAVYEEEGRSLSAFTFFQMHAGALQGIDFGLVLRQASSDTDKQRLSKRVDEVGRLFDAWRELV